MKIIFRLQGDKATIRLNGELDEYSTRTIKEEIDDFIDANPYLRCMTFDFKEVSFIDSTGLGFLIGRYKKLRENKAELLISNVSKQVDKVFRTSGIYKFVPIVD